MNLQTAPGLGADRRRMHRFYRLLGDASPIWLAGLLCVGALCFLLAPRPAAAQAQPAPLRVAQLNAPIPLAGHFAVLRDPSRQWTLADVMSPDIASQFVPSKLTVPNFGVTSDAVWSTFALANTSNLTQTYVLRLPLPSAGAVDFYALPGQGAVPRTIQTGAYLPLTSRPLPEAGFAFPLELAPGATQHYYLRVVSDFSTRPLLILWPASDYPGAITQETFIWTLMLGLILLLSCYNLLVSVVIWDRDFLILALLGIVSTLTDYLGNGFAAPWLGTQATYFPRLMILMVTLSVLAYIGQLISFLNLHQRARWIWRILLGIAVAAAGAALIGLSFSPRVGFAIILFTTPLLLLAALIAAITGVRQGYRAARYFLAAQIFGIMFGAAKSTALLGLVPWHQVYISALPISNLFLIVAMSLALADRINAVRSTLQQANCELAASEQRLRQYLDALPVAVQVYSPALELHFSNQAAADEDTWLNTADGSPSNLRTVVGNTSLRVFGSSAPYPAENHPIARAERGERAHVDDIVIKLSSGETIVEVWAVPLTDTAGNLTTILIAYQDITARRTLEQELASYRGQLEERVLERTAELAVVNATLQARVAELTALNDISHTMSFIGELAPKFRTVARILCDLYAVPGASISLFDIQDHSLHLVAAETHGRAALEIYVEQQLPAVIDSLFAELGHSPRIVTDISQASASPMALHADLRVHGITQMLVVPLLARDKMLGIIVLLTDDPTHLFEPDDLRVAKTAANQVAAAIDVSQLLVETQRRRDAAEALRETTNALSHSLNEETVLATILQQLCRVVACEGIAIAIVEEGSLVFSNAEGLSTRYVGNRIASDRIVHEDASAAIRVLHSGEPLLIYDTQDASNRMIWPAVQIRSWLGVPMIAAGRVLGVLNFDSVRVGAFHPSQIDLLSTFAGQAAIALTNARLYQKAQVTAAQSERQRIARDLHDAVTQSIASASLITEALPMQLPNVDPPVQHNLLLLRKLTKGALAELRALLLELRPESLTAAPLEHLLHHLSQAFNGRMGTQVQLTTNCDLNYHIPPTVQIAAYRIAQESLNNAAKHAHAQHVTINLTVRSGIIRLSILDDGCGFDPQADAQEQRHEQMGLAIMQERATEIGAHLTIDSLPGMGTQVFLVWNESI